VLRLPRRLPRAIATEMLLTGRRMSAHEAARWGLVNQVVPADALMPAAQALAASMVENAPLAMAAVKEVLRQTEGQTVPDAYQALRSGRLGSYCAMLVSEDAQEGPRAFGEKRAPRWSGR
jgi:crotonobetainyl-CoA hydratase